jgi:hypothetical protein
VCYGLGSVWAGVGRLCLTLQDNTSLQGGIPRISPHAQVCYGLGSSQIEQMFGGYVMV